MKPVTYKPANKETYRREILGLRKVLSDTNYVSSIDDGYAHFINEMHMALIGNRRITEKMEKAIRRIIRFYKKKTYNQDSTQSETILLKLTKLRSMIDKCGYTENYIADRKFLVDSFINQVKAKGGLSKKQFIYANNLHKQFKKKIDKRQNNS
jgi:hypothetical protein